MGREVCLAIFTMIILRGEYHLLAVSVSGVEAVSVGVGVGHSTRCRLEMGKQRQMNKLQVKYFRGRGCIFTGINYCRYK